MPNGPNLVTRGVQKTDEPKKPVQTDRIDAKILVRFRFYYIKNQKFQFGFQWQILIHRTDQTEPKYIK